MLHSYKQIGVYPPPPPPRPEHPGYAHAIIALHFNNIIIVYKFNLIKDNIYLNLTIDNFLSFCFQFSRLIF